MEKKLSSKALEANLAETKFEDIRIPPEHQRFLDLSSSRWGISQRTSEFLKEYHHPYSSRSFVVDRWREMMLRDLWFYDSLDEADFAFGTLIDMARALFPDLNDELRSVIVLTLLEFIGDMAERENPRSSILREAIDVLEGCLEEDEFTVIRNTRYFKIHLDALSRHPDFADSVFDITRRVLVKSIAFWKATSGAETWFETRRELFGQDYGGVLDTIGKRFFAGLEEELGRADNWDDFAAVPSFDDLAGRFHQTVEMFDTPLERIYFAVYLLNVPGMHHLKDDLLLDINRLLRNVHQELDEEEMISFAENLFTLFQDLKADHMSTVLDCILTLGKEVIDAGDQEIVDAFIDTLVQFGFVTPGVISIDRDWQVHSNANHIKNIRVWLELVEHDPARMETLLAALIVNLRLEGVFVADTDLFQRDITRLLNSDIAPVYKHVKELARLFPVYFNEIGAEGELRDVTTTLDELSHRHDRLIHFLRKQTHTESNSSHLELVRRILRFWYEGSVEPLSALLPADVLASIDLESEWFVPVNEIIRELCLGMSCEPEGLLDQDGDKLERYLSSMGGADRDKDRVRYLIRIYALLQEKYSFEKGDVITILRRSRLFPEDQVNCLAGFLGKDDPEGATRQVFYLIEELKRVILDRGITEAEETIYHKRHVAAGIPSMYGHYRETKFEAMGLIFRLERVASRLIERMIRDINLNYITMATLRRISNLLTLFQSGLDLEDIPHRRFDSNLGMLESSFVSPSCSPGQYANMIEFLERNVEEFIDARFIDFYDPVLRIVIPQHIEGKHHLPEIEVRQILHRRSEEFYRGVFTSTFLIQTLDNFIASTLNALRNMSDHLTPELVNNVLTYDPELVITSLYEGAPRLDNQIFLGAKAFFLKAMYVAGLPVPPGFVLTTEVFRHRPAILKHPNIAEEMDGLIREHIAGLEQITGNRFGDPRNPLLFSVRSGTAMSMPGAMSTLLNVGINEGIAEGLSQWPGYGRMAWDCYRRFLQCWGMTRGMQRDQFDRINEDYEARYQVARSSDFTREQMREIALEYRLALEEDKVDFEEDPFQQLRQAIIAVMDSWFSERARVFREHLQIAEEWGTAVIVQKMIMGNINESSGTGVLLTHDPYEEGSFISPYGDFRLCSQGEDVVTGWLNILPVTEYHRTKYQYDMEVSLESAFPDIYSRLVEIGTQLAVEYDLGPQEIEFTFESERSDDLYILQSRRQEVRRQDKRFVFSVPHDQMELVGRGIGIGGGALSGILTFDAEDLQRLRHESPHDYRILVRPDTVPDDIGMIFDSDGLITGKGGATSHAAVTAVRLGKVCVVGCRELLVNDVEKTCTINGVLFRSGDRISIEGHLGNIYKGDYPTEFVDMDS